MRPKKPNETQNPIKPDKTQKTYPGWAFLKTRVFLNPGGGRREEEKGRERERGGEGGRPAKSVMHRARNVASPAPVKV